MNAQAPASNALEPRFVWPASRRVAAAALLASAAIRIFLIVSFPGDVDTESYRIVVSIVKSGGNVFHETSRYNYSPFWAVLLVGIDGLARLLRIDLGAAIGIVLSFVDLGTALLIVRILRRRGVPRAELAGALFFLNPASILVSCFHGQFDNIAVLFLLLAVGLYERRPDQTEGVAAWLSLSLLVKHFAWFHPVLFFFKDRFQWRRLILLAPYAVFFLSFLPYLAAAPDIWRNVFLYRGQRGRYGLEFLLYLPGISENGWALEVVFIGACLISIFWLRRLEIGRASLLLMLVMLVALPGFQAHYCVWPMGLGSLYPSLGLVVFGLASLPFLLQTLLHLHGVPEQSWMPGWYGPWWGAVFWLAWELRSLTRAKAISTAATETGAR